MTLPPRPQSGHQITLSAGPAMANIATVGATLRTLSVEGVDLVVPFAADEVRPAHKGAVLVPWPNRVVGGHYRHAGVDQQLAITEPANGHALHGLLLWSEFSVLEQADDRAVLRGVIEAQRGYPHRIVVDVTFELQPDGLVQTVRAENIGPDAAPYGVGPHPYLTVGECAVDSWTLQLPAAEVLDVDASLAPLERRPVDDLGFDFRQPSRIGTRFIDHAFTALAAPFAEVRGPDGSGVRMEFGPETPWVQVHTADALADPGPRRGLAVEPMSCPPDAFNSGEDLIELAPGGSHTASWSIRRVLAG